MRPPTLQRCAINTSCINSPARPLSGSLWFGSNAATRQQTAWLTAGVARGPVSRCLTTLPATRSSSLYRRSMSRPSNAFGSLSPSTQPQHCSLGTFMPKAQIQSSRSTQTMSSSHTQYEAIVVGAGPAGITAMGNLLEIRIAPILWVDDSFDGGRVNQMYREVPSNTKVKLFIDFATATAPFRKIVSGIPSRSRWEEPSASDGVKLEQGKDRLQMLRQLDAEKGCKLGSAADMCLVLTEGLKKTPGVATRQGKVAEAVFNQDTNGTNWTVRIDTHPEASSSTTVQSKRIVLCTGSHPTDPPLPLEVPGLMHLQLDTALSPVKLSASLSPLGPTTIAVIGASHSAVLVLRNLADLALGSKPDLKVKWFTRHGLRYAEYEDGFIARDNTGLKGEAAAWARENLEPETLPNSPVSECITKVSYEAGKEAETYAEHMLDCSFVVQAIGYRRNAIPAIKTSSGDEVKPLFDHDKGVFNYAKEAGGGSTGDLSRLPGLYGAGIAFPERVVDKKYGHEEFNVGFFKFMNATKKWVKEWK